MVNLFEMKVAAGISAAKVNEIVERICAEEGLAQTMKDTLATYPGSIHWHYKRNQKQPGVLEITYWPVRDRLWVSAHQNRLVDWIETVANSLGSKFEAELRPAS